MYKKPFLKAKQQPLKEERPSREYRPSAAVLRILSMVERAIARWKRECDYWWQGDTNVYPFEHIVLSDRQKLFAAAARL